MSDHLILASGSPRRRELLAWTGLAFEVCPAEVNETPLRFESPADYVSRLAKEKAKTTANGFFDKEIVLAADTTVADGEQILGKPQDAAHAREMLNKLRGHTHQVYTALAIYLPSKNRILFDRCRSDVPMRQYSDDELDAYIETGDPMDKAGAYAIQNQAFKPVIEFHGCFANVMGLPLCHLMRTLSKIDIILTSDLPVTCQKTLDYSCPVFSAVLDGQYVG